MRTILFGFMIVLIYSCSSGNQNTTNRSNTTGFEPSFRVSARTSLFINDYLEYKHSKAVNEKQPPELLLEKYHINKTGNKYVFSGIMKVNSDFETCVLNDLKITRGTRSNNILTVQVPLSSLEEFFSLSKIEYFELATYEKPKIEK